MDVNRKKNYCILLTLVLCICFTTVVRGQNKHKFNPAKFEADLEQFITLEAGLTPNEASVFFPVYREMRKKQFAYFGEDRRMQHINPNDERACAEAIRKRDKNDIELKVIQQTYHERFMTILPANKVFKILRAEDKFHKQKFIDAKNCGTHKSSKQKVKCKKKQ